MNILNLVGIISADESLDNYLSCYNYYNSSCSMTDHDILQSRLHDQILIDHSKLDAQYTLETNKHYKIWFNKDPEIFLSDKNQLRLQQMRSENPNAQISLVYSTELMSLKAKNELYQFLDIHNINGVDFDKTLNEALHDTNFPETELKLLMLTKAELNNSGNKGNGGGNLAAASDILRFCPSIANLGIYSDLDVHPKFGNISLLNISTPLIIAQGNNDFIAFAKANNEDTIHQVALNEIYKVQKTILQRYQNYNSTSPEFDLNNIEPLDYYLPILFKKAQAQGKPFSLIEYRAQIKNLDIYDLLGACSVNE